MSAPLIPYGILTANAAPPYGLSTDGDYFFYDERFAEARRLAGRLYDAKPITPVKGDITGIWNAGLKHACLWSPITLRGVTTESFYFCLDVMLRSRAGVKSRITRVNRDLYEWTIRSGNKTITG